MWCSDPGDQEPERGRRGAARRAGQEAVTYSSREVGQGAIHQSGRLSPAARVAVQELRVRAMILTSLQRDFLDRYSLECVFCRTESTYARDLARQHGFTYEHMGRLWDAYCRSRRGDSDRW